MTKKEFIRKWLDDKYCTDRLEIQEDLNKLIVSHTVEVKVREIKRKNK